MNGLIFAVALGIYEILVCFIYGFEVSYSEYVIKSVDDISQVYLLAFLTLLALVGTQRRYGRIWTPEHLQYLHKLHQHGDDPSHFSGDCAALFPC
jgi:hypothetical protein